MTTQSSLTQDTTSSVPDDYTFYGPICQQQQQQRRKTRRRLMTHIYDVLCVMCASKCQGSLSMADKHQHFSIVVAVFHVGHSFMPYLRICFFTAIVHRTIKHRAVRVARLAQINSDPSFRRRANHGFGIQSATRQNSNPLSHPL